MASFSIHCPWIFTFGLLGNLISFVVFLAPIPTFVRICRKKTTEGFQSLPYVVALFSAMIWLYYASLKSDVLLLITINSFGCFIEMIYISLYVAYAPKQARIATLRILLLFNFGGFCSILLLSHFFVEGSNRVKVLGWVCVIFSVSVFAAPLSIMRIVIRTKSVEFMPFTLSFFLTLSAITWLVYGVLQKDYYIAIPNIVGFIFGVLQMVLYVIYKNFKTEVPMEPKLPQHSIDVAKLSSVSCEMKPAVFPQSNEEDDHTENSKDPSNQEHPNQFEV